MNVAVCNRQRRRAIPVATIRALAAFVAKQLHLPHTDLNIVLISDPVMARLNQQYHKGSGTTDILTFDYGDVAELIISVDRALAHAHRYRTTPVAELARYVVHGLLHLAGWDDNTAAARRQMRAAERRWLARALPNMIEKRFSRR